MDVTSDPMHLDSGIRLLFSHKYKKKMGILSAELTYLNFESVTSYNPCWEMDTSEGMKSPSGDDCISLSYINNAYNLGVLN